MAFDATHMARELARYRSLSASTQYKALSSRHPRQCSPQHSGQCHLLLFELARSSTCWAISSCRTAPNVLSGLSLSLPNRRPASARRQHRALRIPPPICEHICATSIRVQPTLALQCQSSRLAKKIKHSHPRRPCSLRIVAEPTEFGALRQTPHIEAMSCVGI
jgi:hypothetical protein